jgi:hypothetical protein
MSQESALAIYDFIAKYRAAHAFSPAVFDIALGCKLSTKAVRASLEAMEQAGYIRRRNASLVPLKRPDLRQAQPG